LYQSSKIPIVFPIIRIGNVLIMSKKLVIQIPCFNEAQTLSQTIADLPKSLPGFDRIIILVVDDGSSDETVQIARKSGADYVVCHRRNRGLARAFMTGLITALALGADVIVNTDADHQYPGRYIKDLVNPIISGSADLVIGDRQPGTNIHFSPIKQILEKFGSWVIRRLSQTDAPDAPSGFRAYSRYAALRMQVYNSYSYTLETLIQAGKEKMAIAHIPIETNPALRPSRLHKGILNFIWRQSGTIIRSYILYQPLKTFLLMGIPFLLAGGFFLVRFLFFYFLGEAGVGRYSQSVSIGGTLAMFGAVLILMGLIGDAVRANRKILEEILIQLREKSYASSETISEINGSPVLRKENDNDGRDI
jgi:glycosyltransferase involved in cell wall biosynthesis